MGQFHVRSQAELAAALSQAKGGDAVLLAPGARFDKIELRKGFDAPLTIASADPNKPAKVLALNLNGAKNVTVDSVVFDHTGESSRPFAVDNSSAITIRNSFFDGHTDSAGFGRNVGLQVKLSDGVRLEGNTVKTFNNGFGFTDSKNITVRGNEIVDVRNDGMTLAGISNIVIEGNKLHKFRSPDSLGHKDAIQVWTTNTTASTGIVIRDNVFECDGHRQTIFIGNEAARGSAAATPHRDILIEGNSIKATHTHGISVEHVSGVVIRGNVLDTPHGAPGTVPSSTVPLINVTHSSANVTITDNTVAAVQKEVRASWTIEDNNLTTGKSFWHWSGSSSVPRVNEGPSKTYLAWTSETADASAPVTAKPAPTAPADDADGVVFAVNAGGGRVIGADGVVYEADRSGNWTGSRAYTDGSYGDDRALAGGDYTRNGVANGNDVPYATERVGSGSSPITFTRTDIDPGQYVLTLKFAEIWDPHGAAGKRVFDVLVNGKRVIDDLDLAKVAGPNRALDVDVPVTVGADGKLVVSGVASRDLAKFSAIVLRETDAEHFRFNTAGATGTTDAKTGTTSLAAATTPAPGGAYPVPAGEFDYMLGEGATFRAPDAFDLG